MSTAMKTLNFFNRKTQKIEKEDVYFEEAVRFLYGNSLLSRLFGTPIVFLISRFSLFSHLFGWWNRRPGTRKKVAPFIEKYQLDPKSFLSKVEDFRSFDDFFVRKLKPETRPIDPNPNVVIAPADGRYLIHPEIDQIDGFFVKGETFDLAKLLKDSALTEKYQKGAMVIARLCPTDYHRYHFPVTCTPSTVRLINGFLYSVNPIALARDISIFTKNKRTVCSLKTEQFGTVLFMEVGATNVGSIHQTFKPGELYEKGKEKGFFSFGGSTVILLFEPGTVSFDRDLVEYAKKRMEVRCLMGERIGVAANATTP